MLTLFPHQDEGVKFLISRPGALLAYEQGLGKTLVALVAFDRLKRTGEVARLLVICPNSLKLNWADEIKKFVPHLTCFVLQAIGRSRRRLLQEAKEDIVVVNYEAARSEITSLRAMVARHACALVLDESHFVKNIKSLNALVAGNLVSYTKYRWLLSGTPITNKPIDIYSQIGLVTSRNPLGTPELFEARFGSSQDTRDKTLSELLKPYLIRKTKAECLNLPDKVFNDVAVELPDWQREMYDAFRDNFIHEVERMNEQEFAKYHATALTRLLRLSQIASNPSLVNPDETRLPAKFESIDALLDSTLLKDEKVIIWSNYVKTIKSLAARYSSRGVEAIYGETETSRRQEIAHAFQTDSSVRILVANPAAAGTGFTFTSARFAIFETLSWRYDHFAQSQDRNHRIGQQREVTYIRLLAKNTIEEAIVRALLKKETIAKGILGDEDLTAPIAKLTQSELLSLLRENTIPSQ
jgi:SNF2 family DNA or RNA helicase